jgi:hypothetical protein
MRFPWVKVWHSALLKAHANNKIEPLDITAVHELNFVANGGMGWKRCANNGTREKGSERAE